MTILKGALNGNIPNNRHSVAMINPERVCGEDAVLHQLERLKRFDLGQESRRRWFRWGQL
jgi:hypothetical protein